ncbi:MAG: haloacid dehalogenase [Candidatus Rokuibacteriota bacterium]|nr:MAG: haloacid dehalogenase [Candidatus Rokubacteria bacterium]
MTPPRILALDFDGVVCDGRPEYFETAWQAYVAAWPAPALTSSRPARIAARFSALRPLIESGWEMPLLVHALLAGVGDEALKDRHAWLAAPGLMKPAGVSAETLGRALNTVRDDWFARDSAGWLAHHHFYPGVAGQIATLLGGPIEVVVVTTKAERFVRLLLTSADPRLAQVTVIGREPGKPVPKPDILRRLADRAGLGADAAGLWFVEDMLETLEATAQRPALAAARLFLADWGYNTPDDRAAVARAGRIHLLSLTTFAGPLARWGGVIV